MQQLVMLSSVISIFIRKAALMRPHEML